MNEQDPSLRARWQTLSPREQNSLRLALGVVLAALLWLLLAPAIATLRTAPGQQFELQRQLQTMRRQQAQAQALQSQPRVTLAGQTRALALSLAPLGASARLEVRGNQAVVTLQQLPPAALAQWLQQLHSQLHLQPVQVRLQRHPATSSWNGNLSFALAADPN